MKLKATNIHAGVGAGKNRQPWRIKEFLDSNGMDMATVARALGLANSTVSRTVAGTANNERVLIFLIEMGCPRDVLSLPPKILGERR